MNATVLIVDDEVPFVDAMRKRLTKRNIDIVTAYSGPEALDALQKNGGIEIVILDVKMPGMSGIQTLRQIRSAHPEVEVIMLTGHAAMETAIEGMKLGAFDYLMKPCSIEQVLARIHEAKKKRAERKIG